MKTGQQVRWTNQIVASWKVTAPFWSKLKCRQNQPVIFFLAIRIILFSFLFLTRIVQFHFSILYYYFFSRPDTAEWYGVARGRRAEAAGLPSSLQCSLWRSAVKMISQSFNFKLILQVLHAQCCPNHCKLQPVCFFWPKSVLFFSVVTHLLWSPDHRKPHLSVPGLTAITRAHQLSAPGKRCPNYLHSGNNSDGGAKWATVASAHM